jgi:hypothetical protein
VQGACLGAEEPGCLREDVAQLPLGRAGGVGCLACEPQQGCDRRGATSGIEAGACLGGLLRALDQGVLDVDGLAVPVPRRQGALRLVEPGARLLRGRRGRGQLVACPLVHRSCRGHELVRPCADGALAGGHRQIVQLPTFRQVRSGRLAQSAHHGPDQVLVCLVRGTQRLTVGDQPPLDLLEAARPEQPLQHLVPLVRLRPQERLEASLGEHRHLGELADVHPEQVGHQVTGLVEPVGQVEPVTVDLLLEVDLCLLGDGAAAALLRPLPRG